MLEVTFGYGINSVIVGGLVQWDYGQKVKIIGLNVPETLEVHFSNDSEKEAIVMVATVVDGNIVCDIPNVLLEKSLDIKAWVYVIGENSGETIKMVTMRVEPRIKPQDFISHNPDAEDLLADAINKINDNIKDNEEFKNDLQEKVDSGYFDGEDGQDGLSAYELAVKNGYQGTEQEWLESLRYDHSDEFKQLSEQVKQDANSAEDSATKAENAMNEANTTAQANVKAINKASTDAQNAITTSKDSAVKAISDKQIEAVQAVDTAKTSATQAITEQKENVLTEITQEKNSATEAIETSNTNALNDIETAKDNAIEEIENTGVPLEDIEKLAIKENAEGNPTIISDSADWKLKKLNICGESEQASTTGINLLDYPKKKVDDSDYYDVDEDGYVIQLRSDNRATNTIPEIIKLPSGQYTALIESNDANEVYFQVYDLTNDKQLVIPNSKTNKSISFNLSAECSITFKIYKTDGTLGKARVQINQTLTAQPWEPYTGGKPSPSPDYPQETISKEVSEIKVTGANLIKYPYYQNTRTMRGVTFTVNDDQSITINGTNDGTGNSEFRINSNDRFKKGDSISTGLISDKDDENVWVNAFYVGNIGINEKIENRIVDDEEKSYDLIITVASGATIDNVTIKVMRNYGAKLLPYEPYKSQTITLPEPITLRGIPVASGGNVTIDEQSYIADYVDSEKGKLIQLIASMVVTSKNIDNIENAKESTNLYAIINIEMLPSNRKALHADPIYCNILKRNQNPYGSNYNSDEECVGYTDIENFLRFNLDKNGVGESPETLKSYLDKMQEDGTPVVIDYVMATPIEIDLPQEIQEQYKALKSYYPNTVIQSGAFNEVTYVADTDLYIQKKLESLNTALLATQTALLDKE